MATSAAFTECCGASIKTFRLKGEKWFECARCGAVLEL